VRFDLVYSFAIKSIKTIRQVSVFAAGIVCLVNITKYAIPDPAMKLHIFSATILDINQTISYTAANTLTWRMVLNAFNREAINQIKPHILPCR